MTSFGNKRTAITQQQTRIDRRDFTREKISKAPSILNRSRKEENLKTNLSTKKKTNLASNEY